MSQKKETIQQQLEHFDFDFTQLKKENPGGSEQIPVFMRMDKAEFIAYRAGVANNIKLWRMLSLFSLPIAVLGIIVASVYIYLNLPMSGAELVQHVLPILIVVGLYFFGLFYLHYIMLNRFTAQYANCQMVADFLKIRD